MDFQVRLDNFTGPLDLLLFFIRRDEIDIMDIPIARITEEYLSYLKTLQSLDVGIAGGFLVMAATLMRIKARMLLPRIPTDDQEEPPEDPRTELVQQLLEYQRYKEAAENLSQMADSQSRKFPHLVSSEYQDVHRDPSVYVGDVSLYKLGVVFKRLLEQMPPSFTYDVTRDEVSVREKMAWLLSRFVERDRYRFSELFSGGATRQELIATFMAILELIRNGQLRVIQKKRLNDFVVERNLPEPVGEA